MLRTSTILILAPLLSLVSAAVNPSEPGPGMTYVVGQTCRTTWNGDTVSPDDWKNMSIQLMTGDNFAMVHLTTVATGQDGSRDGVFEYPCPDVTPYSSVYFYQFTSPNTDEKTWATRFAIAPSPGATVPPPNPRQPGTNGAAIPWGVGRLVDAASAVPAPAYLGGTAPGPATTATSTTSTTQTTTATTSLATTAPSGMTLARTNTTTTGAPKTTSNSTTTGAPTGAASLGFAVDRSVIMGVIAGAVLSVFAL